VPRRWNSKKKNNKRRHKPHIQKKNKRYREAVRALGYVGNDVGKAGEQRVFKACRHGDFPSWWLGSRPATQEEDVYQETDLVVHTDVGDIPLQVKTSLHKRTDRIPQRSKQGVAIICVSLDDSDDEIKQRTIRLIDGERKRMLQLEKEASR